MTDLEAAELVRYMENWGYTLSEPTHPRSPGYGRLIIAMRRFPTEAHYDPEAIHLLMCGTRTMPVRTTVQMDTTLVASAKICPGLIEMRDRVDARRAFYTYGATIDRGNTGETTVIDIQSPAPILELTRGTLDESASEQLVSETEALWAKERVRFGADDLGFTRSLGAIEPTVLYASTVHTLWESYQESRILRQTFPQFYSMLRRESEWLKNSGYDGMVTKSLHEMLNP